MFKAIVVMKKDVYCINRGKSRCLDKIKKGEKVVAEIIEGEPEPRFYCRNCGIERLEEIRDELFKVEEKVYGSGGA
jgi:uncharacterized Fe-S cluster-containing protein